MAKIANPRLSLADSLTFARASCELFARRFPSVNNMLLNSFVFMAKFDASGVKLMVGARVVINLTT